MGVIGIVIKTTFSQPLAINNSILSRPNIAKTLLTALKRKAKAKQQKKLMHLKKKAFLLRMLLKQFKVLKILLLKSYLMNHVIVHGLKITMLTLVK